MILALINFCVSRNKTFSFAMIIDIYQKKLSLGDKYKVFINHVLTYVVSKQPLQLKPEILVMDTDNNMLKIRIVKCLQWIKAKYVISFSESQVYSFKTVSYFRSHFQCITKDAVYDIYRHRGRKCSIYKDHDQIAWWQKDLITWLEGDTYRITSNENADIDLLISFCLILDNYTSGNKGEDVLTINLGYMGLQAKRFNKEWVPNRQKLSSPDRSTNN